MARYLVTSSLLCGATRSFSSSFESWKSKKSRNSCCRAQECFGKGDPNVNYAKYFIGNSYLKQITSAEDGFRMSNVTFEPGTRNNWHIHHAKKGGGQVLIVTAGSGWYQLEGKPAVSLNPGDAVVIPANVKHWHGAKKDSWFSHIAFEAPGEGMSNEWLEPVSDEEYNKL